MAIKKREKKQGSATTKQYCHWQILHLGNNYFIVVSKEGDKLIMLGPNLPKYQLLAASETEYFAREMNVRLTFKVNGDGKSNSVILNINGTEQTAKKVND